MKEYDVKSIVFSSSATVYGTNNPSPMTEDIPTSASVYGYTKLMMEQILTDVAASDQVVVCLKSSLFQTLSVLMKVV